MNTQCKKYMMVKLMAYNDEKRQWNKCHTWNEKVMELITHIHNIIMKCFLVTSQNIVEAEKTLGFITFTFWHQWYRDECWVVLCTSRYVHLVYFSGNAGLPISSCGWQQINKQKQNINRYAGLRSSLLMSLRQNYIEYDVPNSGTEN